jgi:site-specific DNA recombinase
MTSHLTISALQPPLTARRGGTLRVLGIARISTIHQDKLSLEDQEALYRQWLDQHACMPYKLYMIASQGSGERLDRKEYKRAKRLIKKRRYDLVLTEDLARITRRVDVLLFCEDCEDAETRLIAINDHVDTGRDDWRLHSFFATFRHETYNRDTARRIRRSLRNRFAGGGVFQCTIYGYLKPPGAKSEADVTKDPAAEPVYEEWFRRLEDDATFSEIADWLNDTGVPTGPYCRSKSWTCQMVGRITRNPILKGMRIRNQKMSRRINRTGRRRSVNAPLEERLERDCPHLAFIQPERYDRVLRLVNAKNAKYRAGKGGSDPRKDRPKKRTRWPGQHLDCGICGRPLRYGAHGQNDHLFCAGAYEYRCWQAISVDGPKAARKLAEAIRQEITTLPGFDPALLSALENELAQSAGSRAARIGELDRAEQTARRQQQNILNALREAGPLASLLEDLKSLEADLAGIAEQRDELAESSCEKLVLPSMDDIKSHLLPAFDKLALESPQFARYIRRLVPRIVVHPVRLCDGGHIGLRAHFTLHLVNALPFGRRVKSVLESLQRRIVVDLFDPPQREAYRLRVMELKAQLVDGRRMTEREIATALGITQPAVQQAVALVRKMSYLDVSDPYVPLTEPPADYTKLRRHKHPRYCFEPLRGPESAPEPA